MNYILAVILAGLVLVALYFWSNGGKTNPLSKLTGGQNEESTEEQEVVIPTQEPVQQQVPGGDHSIPMPDHHSMAYPSGILPGKVGTFHPTNDCDRFLCNGCWTCGPVPRSKMTDDRGRNYPGMIDAIRESKTSEYPFYKMS